jgi:hypothetical protein
MENLPDNVCHIYGGAFRVAARGLDAATTRAQRKSMHFFFVCAIRIYNLARIERKR